MDTKPCRACGAPMVWVRTAKGKAMPLDAEPTPDGAFVFDGDPEDRRVTCIGEKAVYSGERFTSHFATCPDAKSFRTEESKKP
jgi:hypothetical protein